MRDAVQRPQIIDKFCHCSMADIGRPWLESYGISFITFIFISCVLMAPSNVHIVKILWNKHNLAVSNDKSLTSKVHTATKEWLLVHTCNYEQRVEYDSCWTGELKRNSHLSQDFRVRYQKVHIWGWIGCPIPFHPIALYTQKIWILGCPKDTQTSIWLKTRLYLFSCPLSKQLGDQLLQVLSEGPDNSYVHMYALS